MKAFHHTYPARPESARLARRDAAAFLAIEGSADVEAILVVSELVANSIRHAYPSGDGVVQVTIQAAQPPRIIVTDYGVGGVDEHQQYGVGLRIVDTLCEHLEISSGAHGTMVTARLARSEARNLPHARA